MNKETIYALSTPYGKSAIAVFRVSGPNCIDIIKKHTDIKKLNRSQQTHTNFYIDKKNKKILDKVVAVYLRSPKSYTGEDMLEISTHGSRAIIKGFIEVFTKTKLCRLADAGEFTRRGFENNKFDLLQTEAISDLINAETEEQKEQAVKQLDGGLSKKIKYFEDQIKKILANTEAIIDFSDDEVPKNIEKKIKEQTKNIIKDINNFIKDDKYGERIRSGFYVTLIGKTNIGKSSLINYLAKRDVSIVTKTPGTTRDLIEIGFDLWGLPVFFIDTAGIRKSKNNIENIGIKRAIEMGKKSAVNIVFIEKLSEVEKYNNMFDNNIFVQSKSDINKKLIKLKKIIKISSKSGYGIQNMLKKIHIRISRKTPKNSLVSRERHRNILKECLKTLDKSRKISNIDLVSEEIRKSLNIISKITGKTDINEILDIIFKEFCIGK